MTDLQTLSAIAVRLGASTESDDLRLAGRAAQMANRLRESAPMALVVYHQFVWLGPLDDLVLLDRPDLAGLDDFVDIVLGGVTAAAWARAERMVGPVRHPENALRGRLKKVSDWIRSETRDKLWGTLLAGELIAPCLSIEANGTIVRRSRRPIVTDIDALPR